MKLPRVTVPDARQHIMVARAFASLMLQLSTNCASAYWRRIMRREYRCYALPRGHASATGARIMNTVIQNVIGTIASAYSRSSSVAIRGASG